MSELSDFYRQLAALPKGYISKKTIHGKVYYYHQYLEQGKLVSRYVSEEEASSLSEQFALRKKIASQIKEYERSHSKNFTLSTAARNFDGYLMMGDEVVATFDKGALTDLDEKRCPLIVKRTHSIEAFLSGRVLDSSRTNARLLKKALGIHESKDEYVSLYAYGACIGDNYWFKPKHSKLHYKDVTFDSDAYAELSLQGKLHIAPKAFHLSPEVNTRGSLEKGWKKIDGHWRLYKSETKQQAFSEIFASLLARRLGIPSVLYGYEDPYVYSNNFAIETNFEPMVSYLGDNEDYGYVFSSLRPLGEKIQVAYLCLMRFDALVGNVDRHNENYGLMRDRRNGDIVSLSPNFDNNLCLLGYQDQLPSNPRSDSFMKLFLAFIKKEKAAKELLSACPLPLLEEEEILALCKQVPIPCPIEEKELARFILRRIALLNEAILSSL